MIRGLVLDYLAAVLRGLLARPEPRRPVGLAVVLSPVSKTLTTAGGIPMPLSLNFNYRATIPAPLDDDGDVTSYDGPVAWESMTPDVADVRADSPDGMVGFVETKAQGTLRYKLSADLDKGPGTKPFSVEFEVEVDDDDAVGITEPGFEAVAKTEEPPVPE